MIFSIQDGKIDESKLAKTKLERDNLKKDRLFLNKTLKEYFGLLEDPIIRESESKYAIQIKLIPSPDFRKSYIDYKKGIFDTSEKEYLSSY